jgi:hypothetical protein
MQPGDEQDPIARELDAMPRIEPPADLRRSIMQAVRDAAAYRKTENGKRKTLLIPAAIWASAAAIIIAFVLYTRTASDHATATMAPIQTSKTTLTIEREGDFIRLEPTLHHAGSISIRWDPKTAEFVALRGGSNASSGNGHIAFYLRGPADRAAVILRPRPHAAAVDVRVAVDGDEVIRTNIPLR